MKAKKIYVRPETETIDMDGCLLENISINKGGGVVDEGDELAPRRSIGLSGDLNTGFFREETIYGDGTEQVDDKIVE